MSASLVIGSLAPMLTGGTINGTGGGKRITYSTCNFHRSSTQFLISRSLSQIQFVKREAIRQWNVAMLCPKRTTLFLEENTTCTKKKRNAGLHSGPVSLQDSDNVQFASCHILPRLI